MSAKAFRLVYKRLIRQGEKLDVEFVRGRKMLNITSELKHYFKTDYDYTDFARPGGGVKMRPLIRHLFRAPTLKSKNSSALLTSSFEALRVMNTRLAVLKTFVYQYGDEILFNNDRCKARLRAKLDHRSTRALSRFGLKLKKTIFTFQLQLNALVDVADLAGVINIYLIATDAAGRSSVTHRVAVDGVSAGIDQLFSVPLLTRFGKLSVVFIVNDVAEAGRVPTAALQAHLDHLGITLKPNQAAFELHCALTELPMGRAQHDETFLRRSDDVAEKRIDDNNTDNNTDNNNNNDDDDDDDVSWAFQPWPVTVRPDLINEPTA